MKPIDAKGIMRIRLDPQDVELFTKIAEKHKFNYYTEVVRYLLRQVEKNEDI